MSSALTEVHTPTLAEKPANQAPEESLTTPPQPAGPGLPRDAHWIK